MAATSFRLGAPPTLGDEQVQALREVFESTCTALTDVWSTALNSECVIAVESIALSDIASLPELEPARSSATAATITGVPGAVLAVVPVELALIAVDLMLGGPGRPIGTERALTSIDADLLTALVAPTLDAMGEVLGEILGGKAPLPAVVDAPSTDATTLDLHAFESDSIVVRFTTTRGEDAATWLLALTGAFATALLGRSASQVSATTATETFRAQVERRLVDVPLHASVEFPPISMRSTDLIALRVDDVVPLGCPVNGWLRLVIDGETVANARAARSGEHLACQIVTTFSSTPSEPANASRGAS